jgi:putative ABC transport system permease protein
MTPDEVRRQAMIEFGDIERTREQCYEQRPGRWLGTVVQDVHYALRIPPRPCLHDSVRNKRAPRR